MGLSVKNDFPIFSSEGHKKPFIYLDNAATSQKPHHVIEAMSAYYESYNANVHRGVYAISERATEAFEEAREKMARFINAPGSRGVIFTKGATEAFNLLAYAWGGAYVKRGDNVVIPVMEHHSNFIPWQQLCIRKEAEFRVVPVDQGGVLDLDVFASYIDERTKLVSVTHASNMFGTVSPISEIVECIKKKNKNTVVAVDGAQAVPHIAVDVQKLGCDFYVIAGHKMLGPTGIGVLWGREEILNEMPSFLTGGHMIQEAYNDHATWTDIPHKFEAGTQNIAGAIGLGAAVDYLTSIGMEGVESHERELTAYAFSRLAENEGVTVYGPRDPNKKVGVVTFNIEGIHAHDVAQVLADEGVCIRAGHHCTQPLHRALNIDASARASFYLYTEKSDIDVFIGALRKTKEILS